VSRYFPQFAGATDGGSSRLLSRAVIRHYAKGERVASVGQNLEGLYLILKGQASLAVLDHEGLELEISRIREGEYFGEQGILRGRASDISVTALEDLQVLVLDAASLEVLLDRMPRLAREIGSLMDIRRRPPFRRGRHRRLRGRHRQRERSRDDQEGHQVGQTDSR
jgi:CRP-like cAMP-binding protein